MGKYYELFFELLFQFVLQSGVYKEEFLVDLLDSFAKALVYNYEKNSGTLFYKFFLLNYLNPIPERAPPTTSSNEILASEPTNLEHCLQLVPLKVFKPHLLVICSFAFIRNDQGSENNVFKTIFMRLLQEDPFDICYAVEKYRLTLGEAPFFTSLHEKLQHDMKMLDKVLTYSQLG